MIYQVVGSYDNELQEVELKQFFSKDNALEYAEWIASFFDFDSVFVENRITGSIHFVEVR